MTVATHEPRLRMPGWRVREQLAKAKREESASRASLLASYSLADRAALLAGRLNNHRQENHFAMRIETLFKEHR